MSEIFPTIFLEKFTTHLYFKLSYYFRKNFWKFFYSVFLKAKWSIFAWVLIFLDELLSKSESVEFSLIESVICLLTDWISNLPFHWFISAKIFFTDKSVNFHWLNPWNKYFSLLNQLISTEVISEIWLIYSNLLLAIWIRQISLIITRFWLIQI